MYSERIGMNGCSSFSRDEPRDILRDGSLKGSGDPPSVMMLEAQRMAELRRCLVALFHHESDRWIATPALVGNEMRLFLRLYTVDLSHAAGIVCASR